MDNQNNQNQQNGYTNFNNYQPDPNQVPAQPTVDPTQQQIPQQPYPQQTIPQGYQVQQTPVKDNSTLLGVFSIILGFISLFFCPYVFACGGIALGITGKNKNSKSVACWIGIILGIISLVINIIWSIYVATHPEVTQNILNSLGLN